MDIFKASELQEKKLSIPE